MAAAASSAVAPIADPEFQKAVAAVVARSLLTLHGFQVEMTDLKPELNADGELVHTAYHDVNKSHIVLAWLSEPASTTDDWRQCKSPDYAAIERELRARTGLGESVTIHDFLGHYSLRLLLKDYAHVERVLDTARELWPSFVFRLATKLEPLYDERYVRVSAEQSEAIFVRRMTGAHGDIDERYLARMDDVNSLTHLLGDERLWKTDEGKRWARSFRERHFSKKRYMNVPTSFDEQKTSAPLGERFDWPLASSSTKRTAADAGASAPPASKHAASSAHDNDAASKHAAPSNNDDGDEDGLCVVCGAEPPDTVTQPCGCCVACAGCSRKLEGTPHEQKCLRCQRRLTKVVYLAELK